MACPGRAAKGVAHRCEPGQGHGQLALAVLLGLLAGATPARASVVLNEVLYDPEGADGGREFVELFNAGPELIVLTDFRLEFANGAELPAVWSVRWRGTAADTLPAGDFFLIVDTGWTGTPSPGATVTLGLQNGPDGLRLVWPAGEDRLGYGGLEATPLGEGEAAAPVAAGQALARRPDGHDSDDNSSDWVPAIPSPAEANFQARAARVESCRAEPPSAPRVGLDITLELRLVNTGLDELPPTTAWLVARPNFAPADSVPFWLTSVPPEGACDLRLAWTPVVEGRRDLELLIPSDACGPAVRVPVGGYQVGPAGPYLSEIVAAPPAGGAEWVEIANAGPQDIQLSALRLRDEDGIWRALPQWQLPAGGFVVLAADASQVVAWWRATVEAGAPVSCGQQEVAAACMELAGAWPSLNNTAPADRTFADRVQLGDSAGVVLDHAVLGADGTDVPLGRSLERIRLRPWGDPARNWGVSPAPAGATPACANALSLAAPAGAEATLAPNPFAPAMGMVQHLQFHLAQGDAGWDARVYDLWGRQVRDLGGDALGPGPRDVVWDGRDDRGRAVASGGFIVCVRRRGQDGGVQGAARLLAVVTAEGAP
mgnify:CR=1 FL=1